MAAPAKLEFESWIETVRKHIEQADQAPHTGRPNFHRGKRRPSSDCAPVQAALESLKSLHDELVIRAAAIELPEANDPASPFSDTLAQQVSNQVAGQVVSTLADQLSQQLSDQISALFETNFKHLRAVDSNVMEDRPAEAGTFSIRITELEQELADLQSCSLSTEEQLRRTAEECETRLTEELAAAQETIAELQVKLDKNSVWSLDRDQESLTEQATMIAELHAEIASLQTTLAASRSDCWQVDDPNPDSSNAKLAAKLTAELANLKQQNTDLASQLAEAQLTSLHNPPHLYLSTLNQESLTWEQRKRLIMQQFESESAAENHTEPSQNRIEIEDVLRSSQAEIDRRDREIAELKSIVEQQSNTHEGVAIGAAAIAQMLDSDELVKLEREKLAVIQREWESKLRDAEIQISTERAKLSRERVELESQIRKLSEQTVNLPPQLSETKVDGKPVRRWLEHLGLRET